jgi:hypothetical protein
LLPRNAAASAGSATWIATPAARHSSAMNRAALDGELDRPAVELRQPPAVDDG